MIAIEPPPEIWYTEYSVRWMPDPSSLIPQRRRVVGALVVGLLASVATTGLSAIDAFSRWETRAIDTLLVLEERVPAPEIAVVAIDEEAFELLGEKQPLPRRYLADLGEFLFASGARMVAFDIVLRGRSTPADDEALVAFTHRIAARTPGRVVFATTATPGGFRDRVTYVETGRFSSDLVALFGYANVVPDGDGVLRHMVDALPATDGGFIPSFALAVLSGYAGFTDRTLEDTVRDRARVVLRLPIRDPNGHITGSAPLVLTRASPRARRIAYSGIPGRSVAVFPSGPLVQAARAQRTPEANNPFRDKIVLVGPTYRASAETYSTPVGVMAGVEAHANMLNTLLSRRTRLPPHWLLNLAALAGACATVSVLSLWLRPLWVFVVAVALIAAFVASSYQAYVQGGYWLDFAAPLGAMLLYLESSRWLARRRLRRAFGQYVSPEVMERVLAEGVEFGGEVRTVSVLMSDLRGFTTLSETLPPAQITRIVNEYFTAMVEVVLANHGVVHDFIGDAILVVYGAPIDDREHAWHAVTTALGMQSALETLNTRWRAEAHPTLSMGIAIHTGDVFAGNVGSPRRKKYTVMGDTVNTAARIEGLNRELATKILLSETTFPAVRDRCSARSRGRFHLKGRAQEVEVFELA
jgi:adenylate cyclase